MSQSRASLLAALEGRWMQTADGQWHQVIDGRIHIGSRWMSLKSHPAYNAYALAVSLRSSRAEWPEPGTSGVTVVALEPPDTLGARLAQASAGGAVCFELEVAGERLSADALRVAGVYVVAAQGEATVRVPIEYIDTLCVCARDAERPAPVRQVQYV